MRKKPLARVTRVVAGSRSSPTVTGGATLQAGDGARFPPHACPTCGGPLDASRRRAGPSLFSGAVPVRTIPGPTDRRPPGWASNPPWSDVWAYFARAHLPRLGPRAGASVQRLAELALAELPTVPTSSDWALWFAERWGHCSPATKNTYRRQLQSVYERAREAGGPAANPLAKRALPPWRERRAASHVFGRSAAEVASTWARVRSVLLSHPRQLAAVSLLRHHGLRPGELRGLERESFEWRGRGRELWARIDGQAAIGLGHARRPLKSERSARWIQLDPACVSDLAGILRSMGPGERLVDWGGRHWRTLRRRLTAVVPELVHAATPWHAWRHAFAREVVPHAPPQAAQDLLGHAHYETTRGYYEAAGLSHVALPDGLVARRAAAAADARKRLTPRHGIAVVMRTPPPPPSGKVPASLPRGKHAPRGGYIL